MIQSSVCSAPANSGVHECIRAVQSLEHPWLQSQKAAGRGQPLAASVIPPSLLTPALGWRDPRHEGQVNGAAAISHSRPEAVPKERLRHCVRHVYPSTQTWITVGPPPQYAIAAHKAPLRTYRRCDQLPSFHLIVLRSLSTR